MNKSIALVLLVVVAVVAAQAPAKEENTFSQTVTNTEGQVSAVNGLAAFYGKPQAQCYQCSAPCGAYACCPGMYPQCCYQGGQCRCCA